ncbi:hypothetical protein [Hyalangium rubrum]
MDPTDCRMHFNLEDVLAVEVVPLYREEAEIVLEKLAQRKP